MDLKQCYEILEIDETASLPQIKQAYRDMIGIWHPDRYVQNPRLYAKATEKLKALNTAYNELITRLPPGIISKTSNQKASSNQKPHILFVTCPKCHQKNRLKAGFVTHHPRCGSCGTLLFQKSHGPGKPDNKTKKTSQQQASSTQTNPNTPKNHFGTSPNFSQATEPIFREPTKKKRLLNKWTVLAILAGIFLIINNYSDLSAWIAKHFQSITESRYSKYFKKPIAKGRNKLDNTDNSATFAVIQKLLSEAGYPVDVSTDTGDENIRTALKQFRDDYFLSFRVGNLAEGTQALLRHRAIVRLQPLWPQIAIDPRFNQWIDQQSLTSPEICRQTLASGSVDQVRSLIDWYQFELLKPKPQLLPQKRVLQKKYHKGLAPLTIRTRSDGRHYYLKLIDDTDASTAMTAFIPSGSKFIEHVPVGKYRVKYAVGQNWYGTRWLFGPKTVFKNLDQVFDFKIKDNQISGYQLDLYLQPMGLISSPKEYAFDF
jgi:hypothetical protein